ncbi:PRA1 family protein 2 [Oryzias latipes]|uniref:PRA1 family protein n=1 Tax=Oryzias latipes TaxID=8090 RepID=A0A3B3IJR5_ORYLA|nr:PRA1 family protein 2 [Oryzias latipes]
MAGVQPPPLRSLDDFLLCSARFAVPDVRDLDRWNHRMINNLLYYQTNYLLSALVLLLIVGYFQPFQMFVGVTVVSIAFLGFVFAAENQATVRRFRRNHPYVSVTAVLLATYLFMLALGGVAVFLFGIAFPVLTVCIHASVRLRSLKNKLENKLESIGLKRTPMGLLLEALGQEQEAGS